jgi:aryl-alcohol dehydrogenase-like predicted oxidoreductase
VSEQSIYNLFTREVELEVLPAAARYGVGIIPWSPLHGGLLGGVLKNAEGRRRQGHRSQVTLREHEGQVRAYEDLCESLGEAPANVALAWLLHQAAVTAPIIGPRTIEQLDQAQRAVQLTLATETLNQLDAIFPGYQPAPQHYAW